jgi:hypothetical protein
VASLLEDPALSTQQRAILAEGVERAAHLLRDVLLRAVAESRRGEREVVRPERDDRQPRRPSERAEGPRPQEAMTGSVPAATEEDLSAPGGVAPAAATAAAASTPQLREPAAHVEGTPGPPVTNEPALPSSSTA